MKKVFTSFLIVAFLALNLNAAEVILSVGTTGRDYSTIQSCEDVLDNDTPLDAGDDAICEMYDDSDFDETVTFNGGATLGINSFTLRVHADSRHDGTANSGARILRTGNFAFSINTPTGFDDDYTFQWLEIDMNGNEGVAIQGGNQAFTNVASLEHMIVHDQSGGNSFAGFVQATSRDMRIMNSIFYDNRRPTSSTMYGLDLDSDRASGGCIGNVVYNIDNTSTGDVIGIFIRNDDTDAVAKNNISMFHVASGGGTALDFSFGGNNPDSETNMSEDASADDSGGTHQISKDRTTQFVSTTNGSEDFHLVSGSDAIDNGTDMGTTPTNVDTDIDGDSHGSNGTWEIGPDDFTATATGTPNKRNRPIRVMFFDF